MILYYKDRALYNESGDKVIEDIELKINPKLPKIDIPNIGKVIRLKNDPCVQAFDDDFGEIVYKPILL